jgi:hypothetical protein
MLADKTLVMKIIEGKDFKADHVYLRVWLADGMGNPKEFKGQKGKKTLLYRSALLPHLLFFFLFFPPPLLLPPLPLLLPHLVSLHPKVQSKILDKSPSTPVWNETLE